MTSSSIPELDEALGGGFEGLNLIQGPVAGGKSILLRHIALAAHQRGVPVFAFDAEHADPQRAWGAAGQGLTVFSMMNAEEVFRTARSMQDLTPNPLIVIDNFMMYVTPSTGVASAAKFWNAAFRGLVQGCGTGAVLVTSALNRSGQTSTTGTGMMSNAIVQTSIQESEPIDGGIQMGVLSVTLQKNRFSDLPRGAIKLDLFHPDDGRRIAVKVKPPIKRRSVWERLGEDDFL